MPSSFTGWIVHDAAALCNSRRLPERGPAGWPTGRRSATASTSRCSTRRSRAAEAAIAALQDFEIVCAMRERTPFRRRVFEALPKLKLLITSGMRNAVVRPRDRQGAWRHGLRHRRGRQSHRRAGHRPDAGTDPQDRLRERPDEGRRALAGHARRGCRRQDAGHRRPRQARQPGRRHRPRHGHEDHRLEHQPDAGGLRKGRRRPTPPRTNCSPAPTSSPCIWCSASARAGWCRARPRADEADRLSDQHRARADRRRGGAAGNAAGAARSPAPGSTPIRTSRCRSTTRCASSTTSC